MRKIKPNLLGGYSRKLSVTITIFILILTGVICSRLASYSFAKYENDPGRHGLDKAASITPKSGCCTQDLDKPHLLAASYYDVRDNLTATLMLNNKGPEAVEVKPTLYSLTGQRLEVASVIVAGESFRNIDLRELGALPGTAFEQGSIQLFHLGPDLIIGAQLYLVNERHSLSFDEKLVEFQNAASTQLESVWWLPSPECATTLILSNTSDVEVTTQAVVQMGKDRAQEVDLTLNPHETKLINLAQEKSVNKPKPKHQVGSASVSYSGPKGAIVARTLVEDSSAGYSFSAQFYAPQAGRSSGYQGVGLRLGTANGEKLSPVVVARNTAAVDSYLTGRMPFTTVDGRDGVVELPRVKLAAGDAQSLDLEKVIRKAIGSEVLTTASLEFEYSTAPGSVLMVAQSVSENGNQVFRVPMWDVPAQRNGTGGYPWFIEGDSSTFVYIKNVTNEEQVFTFSLTYDGGDYSLGARRVKPRQTVLLDLRSLRDNQVPDERNQTIPVTASRGKLVWSVRGRDSLALLGRSEQVDLTKGISSSYACFMCCPNSYRSSTISPSGLGLAINDFTVVQGMQRDQTCYGSLTPWYFWGDTWSVDNSSIASVAGAGNAADVTGIGPGLAMVSGSWEVFYFSMEHDIDGPYCVESSDVVEETAPVQVTKVQKVQYQSGETFVDITGTLYIPKGAEVTFKAVPDPTNGTWPTGKPVWSGTAGATGTGPTKAITFNQLSSSTSDFKTVIVTSGNAVTVNVIVYGVNFVFTPAVTFADRSLVQFGIEEQVALGFTVTPEVTSQQIGGLRYSIVTTGNVGQLTNVTDTGTADYKAPDTGITVTFKLTILAGPAKDGGFQKSTEILEPNGGFITKLSGPRHTVDTWSTGFKGIIHITPSQVSFYNLSFYEGSCPIVLSGWLNTNQFNIAHAQGPVNRITSKNEVHYEDNIYTGLKGPPYGVGTWHWDIPWNIITNSNRTISLGAFRQLATSDANGKAVITKGGRTQESNAADPTSDW